MYADKSDTELLEIIVSELVECDAMLWLNEASRLLEIDADASANITISTAIIQAAMTTYRERYPIKAVQS